MPDMLLTPVCIQLAAAISANGSTYPVDYRFGDVQERPIILVSNTGADCIAVAGSPDLGTTFVTIATSLSATNRVTIIHGPWTHLRFDKTAVNGAATIHAVI